MPICSGNGGLKVVAAGLRFSMRQFLKMAIAGVVALSVTVATAQARTALQDDPTIENGLVLVAAGKMLRDECDDISPRYFKAIAFARALERRAKKLGYDRGEIEAYLDSRTDKNRVKGKARAWLASRGDDICAVGRAEIAGGTTLGGLLKVN